MTDSFLSRWSRKKQIDQNIKDRLSLVSRVERGATMAPEDLGEEGHSAENRLDLKNPPPGKRSRRQDLPPDADRREDREGSTSIPDLAEAQNLPIGADVQRFMRSDVPEDARREALNRLFADPIYNVISDMDDYVEDYSNLPNLTKDELRKLNHIKGLFLFEDPPWKVEQKKLEEQKRQEQQRQEMLKQGPVQAQRQTQVSYPQGEAVSASDSLPSLESEEKDVSEVDDSQSSTVTVSPPPAHLSRPRPSSVKAKSDEFELEDRALTSSVVPSGRRYQPTKRQEST